MLAFEFDFQDPGSLDRFYALQYLLQRPDRAALDLRAGALVIVIAGARRAGRSQRQGGRQRGRDPAVAHQSSHLP